MAQAEPATRIEATEDPLPRCWFGLWFPWLIGLPLILGFAILSYWGGHNFTTGLQGFRWIIFVVYVSVLFLPAFVLATVTLIANHRVLRTRRRLPQALVVVLSSLGVPALALATMSGAHYVGRDMAYAGLDHQAIYDACAELAADLDPGAEILLWPGNAAYKELPEPLARLAPMQVQVTSLAVAVQIDRGSGGIREGIGVLLIPPSPAREKLLATFDQPNPQLPLVIYRLPQARGFLDRVEAAVDYEDDAISER